MASLLERMNIAPAAGPVRQKPHSRSSPYVCFPCFPQTPAHSPQTRAQRTPRGNIDDQWTHDLYDSGSLSARLDSKPTAPRLSINAITQKALRAATDPSPTSTRARPAQGDLSIKGASSSANVVEVANLLSGTTPNDVAAIFSSCGEITAARLVTPADADSPRIRLTYKSPAHAVAAVAKFNNQPADGNVLSVRVIGATSAGAGLGVRLGGADGLGLVRQEGSVDVLMDSSEDSGSKMRSDSLRGDPRAQVLVAPPGANPAEYTQATANTASRRGRGGKGGGRGGGRRGRRGGLGTRMDTD
ncbi:hypothetical protein C0992_005641 [Termitomyces sp. T32_za158]|nr:hypothetical protein C0992_005641 [Termitomyces sp. T32_za158]